MKEYNPQVAEKMREIRSERYLADLMYKIGEAIDEIEQGGLLCSANTHMALWDVWDKLKRIDKVNPKKAVV